MKSVWTAWTLARKFSTLPGILLRTSSLWQPPITFTYSKIRSTSTTVPPPHVPEKREKEEQNAAAQQEIATCLLWWETGSYLWCREKYGQMLAMCKDAARLSQTSSILPCTIILPLLSICISPSVNLFIYRIYSFLCWKEMPDSLIWTNVHFHCNDMKESLIRQKDRPSLTSWHRKQRGAFTKKKKKKDFHSLWNTMPSNFLRNVWLICNRLRMWSALIVVLKQTICGWNHSPLRPDYSSWKELWSKSQSH